MDRTTLKRSSQVLVPSLFTLGNMACGFFALLTAHLGDFASACACILGGIAFDMLDGRVARWVNGESSFGVEFDSLSDFLTFGVAPAYMMYALLLKDYGVFGSLASLSYAICGALRLARFNAVAQSGHGSKTHFSGLPIPAGAGLLASFVLLYQMQEQQPSYTGGFLMKQISPLLAGLGPFLVLALAFLMVSTIPYGAFKQVQLLGRKNLKVWATLTLVLLLIYFYPQNIIFLIFLLYVLSGVAGIFLRKPS